MEVAETFRTMEEFTARLKDYYSKHAPLKIGNVPKISVMMFKRQPELNKKMISNYGEPLFHPTQFISDQDLRVDCFDDSDDDNRPVAPRKKHTIPLDDSDEDTSSAPKAVGIKRQLDNDRSELIRSKQKVPGIKRSAIKHMSSAQESFNSLNHREIAGKESFKGSSNNRYNGSSSSSSKSTAPFKPWEEKPIKSDRFGNGDGPDKNGLMESDKEMLRRARQENSAVEFTSVNPKKMATKSWERYEAYKKARSLEEMLFLGGKTADIMYDFSRGFLKINGHAQAPTDFTRFGSARSSASGGGSAGRGGSIGRIAGRSHAGPDTTLDDMKAKYMETKRRKDREARETKEARDRQERARLAGKMPDRDRGGGKGMTDTAHRKPMLPQPSQGSQRRPTIRRNVGPVPAGQIAIPRKRQEKRAGSPPTDEAPARKVPKIQRKTSSSSVGVVNQIAPRQDTSPDVCTAVRLDDQPFYPKPNQFRRMLCFAHESKVGSCTDKMCPHAHGLKELFQGPKWKTQLCRFHPGRCEKTIEECGFAHGNADLMKPCAFGGARRCSIAHQRGAQAALHQKAYKEAICHMSMALTSIKGLDQYGQADRKMEASVLVQRGRISIRLGDLGAAWKDFDSACHISPLQGVCVDMDGRTETAASLLLELAHEGYRQTNLQLSLSIIKQVEDQFAHIDPGAISAARRLRAVINLKLPSSSQLIGIIKSGGNLKESRSHLNACVRFDEEMPHRYDQHESSSESKRDLAKESKERLSKHGLKGLQHVFEKRLEELLDDFCAFSKANASGAGTTTEESSSDCVEVTYSFKDNMQEVFSLHRSSRWPTHADHADKQSFDNMPTFASKADVQAMLQVVDSAIHTVTSQPDKSVLAVQKLVNKYNKDGVTSLAVAARAKPPSLRRSAVKQLLELGADANIAMDGAIYITDQTKDFGWITDLLQALQKQSMHITADMFKQLVRHRRKCGDTALLMAVLYDEVDSFKQLLQWGAEVDDPEQTRDGLSVVEIAVRDRKTTFLKLLKDQGCSGCEITEIENAEETKLLDESSVLDLTREFMNELGRGLLELSTKECIAQLEATAGQTLQPWKKKIKALVKAKAEALMLNPEEGVATGDDKRSEGANQNVGDEIAPAPPAAAAASESSLDGDNGLPPQRPIPRAVGRKRWKAAVSQQDGSDDEMEDGPSQRTTHDDAHDDGSDSKSDGEDGLDNQAWIASANALEEDLSVAHTPMNNLRKDSWEDTMDDEPMVLSDKEAVAGKQQPTSPAVSLSSEKKDDNDSEGAREEAEETGEEKGGSGTMSEQHDKMDNSQENENDQVRTSLPQRPAPRAVGRKRWKAAVSQQDGSDGAVEDRGGNCGSDSNVEESGVQISVDSGESSSGSEVEIEVMGGGTVLSDDDDR